MPNVKLACVLSCTSDAHLFIDGEEVDLDESGVDKSCEVVVATGSQVHIRVTLEGVELTKWSVTVTPSCPASQPAALWRRSDVFKRGEGGGIILNGDATVPDDPCASHDGLRLMRSVMPVTGDPLTLRAGKRKTRKASIQKKAKDTKKED